MAAQLPLDIRAEAPSTLPPLPAAVAGAPVRWRPLSSRDGRILSALQAAAAPFDHPQDAVHRGVIVRSLRASNFQPANDGIVGLTVDGTPVAGACARLASRPTSHGKAGKPFLAVSLEGLVHPAYRKLGLGRAILAWQEARGRQLLAGAGDYSAAVLTVSTRTASHENCGLYAHAGFTPERRWLSLQRDLSSPIPGRSLPGDLRLRRFHLVYSEPTRLALNDAFRDHWGFSSLDRTEWRREGVAGKLAPRLSWLAVSGHGTECDPYEVAGFALTGIRRQEWALRGASFGHFESVGVRQNRRGEGISTALLVASMRGYQAWGLRHATLDVDADNPSGALDMYQRLGFRERDRSLTYAKWI